MRNRRVRHLLASLCQTAGLLVAALWLTAAQATVLQDFDFNALVAQSPLIIVGTVQDQRVERQGDAVQTHVTFAVEATYKGSAATPMLELGFLGGAADGIVLEVAEQFIPPVGARGVFFFSNPNTRLINPLTGWHQGYFPLMQDAAGADYLDMRKRPDLKIPGLVLDPLVSKMRGIGFSDEAIAAKVPRAFLFPLEDFRLAIDDEVRRAGAVP